MYNQIPQQNPPFRSQVINESHFYKFPLKLVGLDKSSWMSFDG